MEQTEDLEVFQHCQEFIVLNAHKYVSLMRHDVKIRNWTEALFLLTYKQDFILNVRVDGRLDIDNL